MGAVNRFAMFMGRQGVTRRCVGAGEAYRIRRRGIAKRRCRG